MLNLPSKRTRFDTSERISSVIATLRSDTPNAITLRTMQLGFHRPECKKEAIATLEAKVNKLQAMKRRLNKDELILFPPRGSYSKEQALQSLQFELRTAIQALEEVRVRELMAAASEPSTE